MISKNVKKKVNPVCTKRKKDTKNEVDNYSTTKGVKPTTNPRTL